MIINARAFLLILIFNVISCGKSPFLDNDDSSSQGDVIRQAQGLERDVVFPTTKLLVKGTWLKGPFISNESKLFITLTDMEGNLTDPPYEFKVKLWMPTMGHGSFPVAVKKKGVGLFELAEVFFTMEGHWDIHFQFFENRSLIEEVKWGLNL